MVREVAVECAVLSGLSSLISKSTIEEFTSIINLLKHNKSSEEFSDFFMCCSRATPYLGKYEEVSEKHHRYLFFNQLSFGSFQIQSSIFWDPENISKVFFEVYIAFRVTEGSGASGDNYIVSLNLKDLYLQDVSLLLDKHQSLIEEYLKSVIDWVKKDVASEPFSISRDIRIAKIR